MSDTTSAVPGVTAVVITPTGLLVRVVLPRDSSAQLRCMYELIGCRAVDCVRLTNRVDMWVDDEGLINGSPLNVAACLLGSRFGRTQPYVGTVLLTGSADHNGDTLSISDDFIAQIGDLLGVTI